MLIGFDDEESKGWRVYKTDGAHSRTTWTRDVTWLGETPFHSDQPTSSQSSTVSPAATPEDTTATTSGTAPGGSSGGSRAEDASRPTTPSPSPDELDLLRNDEPPPHRGELAIPRHTRALARRAAILTTATTTDGVPMAPASMREAARREDWPAWQAAMREELNALEKKSVLEFTELPTGKRAIGSTWTYRTKTDEHGAFTRRRARLCAQGFSQRPGLDFAEVFAPTADLTTVHLLLTVARRRGWTTHQFDISAAYLHAPLEEEIYMKPPSGLDGFPTGQVCRLRKALYGLRQAGRAWAQHFAGVLNKAGFRTWKSDGTVFERTTPLGTCILTIFTDDVLCAASTPAAYHEVIENLRVQLELVDNGTFTYFLGTHYTRQDGKLRLQQGAYIDALLARHDMLQCNSATIPMGLERLRARTTEEGAATDAEKIDYQSKLGGLLWLSRCTRPDLAYAVGTLGQFAANPSPAHHAAIKRIFRYLRGTRDATLCLEPKDERPLEIWTDADYANCEDTRRSVTGVAVYCYGNLIYWKSKKQATVSLSTMEAEYAALSDGVRAAFHVRNLLLESGDIDTTYCIPVYCDSACATAIFSRFNSHGRLKHLDVRVHHVREKADKGEIRVIKIPGTENRSDIFTKPLARDAFIRATEILGLNTRHAAATGAGGSARTPDQCPASDTEPGGSVGARTSGSTAAVGAT